MSELKKQNSSKKVIKFLFNLWKISPLPTWTMFTAQIIAVTLNMTVAPIFVSQLLTRIANGTANLDGSIWLLTGYALSLVVSIVILFNLIIGLSYISENKMQSAVDEKILHYLVSNSLTFHSNRMSGGIVSDTNKLIGSIERFWDTIVFNIIPITTTITTVCIVLSFIFWQYAVALAILSLIIITIVVFAQSRISPVSRIAADKSSKKTAYLADVIGNISAVKAFAMEKVELTKYKKLINDWRQAETNEMKGVTKVTATFGLMMTIMNVCAFTAAVVATQYHIANIGTIYLVISYTLNVVSQLWDVSNTTRSYIRIIGDAGPMIDTLEMDIEIKDTESPEKSKICNGKIEFKDVCFTHNQNDDALFRQFNLTVKPGEQIGLIGKSGSGKTSLTRLLLRFSEIDGGEIKIDGQNICNITQSDLRSAIAYVPQEPMLFHRTLRENIAYGKPNATNAEVRHAAEQANALDFIDAQKDGFDTMVGERGIKLSGGQRQRIAIARAILKDAPILVLDEATSALDSENEKLIQEALSKLMVGRTSIVIAHRLSTISRLNRIVVMDEGRITEQGSHDELIKNKGIYAKLWSHQSGGFIK